VLATAAAAAVVALFILGSLNRGPSWELASAPGPGQIVIEGESVPLADAELVTRLLRPGARIRCDDSAGFELAAGDQLWIEFTPGSEAILPPSAGRWLGRTVRGRVEDGEVRITTGSNFAGARLRVDTDIAQVELLGTTIAVIDSPDATCVCVYEGSVRVGPLDGPLSPLDAGRRRIVYLADQPDFEEAILPMESMKLQMLQDRAFPGDQP
jgi:hypothetical protein